MKPMVKLCPGWIAAILIVSSVAASAQTNCLAPSLPRALSPDFTLGELQTAIQGARNFMAASQDYQDCIAREVAAQQAAATPEKPFDMSIRNRAVILIETNQRQKEQVGTQVNAAIEAYKKANPGN